MSFDSNSKYKNKERDYLEKKENGVDVKNGMICYQISNLS